MSRVVHYLDCGCAVMDNGRVRRCPSCASPAVLEERRGVQHLVPMLGLELTVVREDGEVRAHVDLVGTQATTRVLEVVLDKGEDYGHERVNPPAQRGGAWT